MAIKGVKGFNQDMTCRGFQYEEGGTYETNRAKACEEGFHFCENPIDALSYYSPAKSVYHQVEGDGQIDRDTSDSKVACTKIKIGAKIDIPFICKATFDYVKSRCTNEYNAEPGKPATAGDSGAATAGDSGCATSRGKSAVGVNGLAVVRGNGVMVKGGIGAILVIAEEKSYNYDIAHWKAVVVDNKNIKADTWYRLEGEELIEVTE